MLEIAKGEDGTSAHEILGVSASKSEQHETERQEQIFAPQTTGFNPSQEANSPQLEDDSAQPQTGNTNVSEYSQEERAHQASATTADDDTREEFGRAVTAGETRQES